MTRKRGIKVPVSSGWIMFTPELQASTSNPAIGTGANANASGVYRRVGDSVQFVVAFTFGSTGAGFGTGSWRIGLPNGWRVDARKIATETSGVKAPVGIAAFWDSSGAPGASTLVVSADHSANSSYVNLHQLGGGSNLNSTAPITWATSDTFNANFTVPIYGFSAF